MLEVSGSDWIFTDLNDAQERYDSNGRLTQIRYRNGLIETLSYDLSTAQGGDDNSNTLDRVVGSFGHTLSFTYDTNGRLNAVTTPDGVIQYSYDANENLISATYPDFTSRTYRYEDPNLPNHLTGRIDENGVRVSTYGYDGSGRVVNSELAGGQESVQLAYNTDGSTTLTLANGASRDHHFSVEQGERKPTMITGDVCSTCSIGQVADRSYDTNGFELATGDWNGNVTQTSRNGRGLTETLIEAQGTIAERTTTTTWHPTYRLPVQIVSPKNTTNFTHDADGNIESITVSDGAVSRSSVMTYNASGQLLTIDGPRTDVLDVTTFTYYDCAIAGECGQLQSVTNALGHVTTFDSYDAAGRLTQSTDPNGLQTAYSYDSRGNVLTVTQTPTAGTARSVVMTYDFAQQLTTVTRPDGRVLTYTYDAAHYLRSITDNLDYSIEYSYDLMGNLKDEDTYQLLSRGRILKRAVDYVHDLNNRLDSASNGGFITDISLDLVGNLTSETDPALATTQHNYDALNRLDQTLDALTGVIDYDYDDHDNLTSVSAANGAQTTYVFDNSDNLIQETSPDRGTVIYTYDNAGNRITMLDARGKLTTYTHDALNRLALETLNDGSTITYEYDTGPNAVGRLSKVTDPSGTTNWSFNNFGEVTTKTQTIGSVALSTNYGFDDQGRLASITLPSGKVVVYGYNTYQVSGVTVDGSPILTGATYEPFGPANSWTWGDGTVASRSYDLRGLMTSFSMAGDTRLLSYDAAGRLSSAIDSRINNTYEYDGLRRLTAFTPTNTTSTGPTFSTPPVLLTTIQTMKNEIGAVPSEPSAPWLTVATKNVSAGGAKVALERGQVNTGSIDVKEKIGYLAIETGSGSLLDSGGNQVTYESQITPEFIQGWGTGCFDTTFVNTYLVKPVVMASLNTHNGGDGGWLRRCTLNKTTLGLTVDEDKFGDPERRHNNSESAGLVAFSQAFDAQFTDGNGDWGMEIAKVTLLSTATIPEFTSITFRQAYATKPVVLVLPNKSGSNPASVRIRNVSKTGFEVVQVEPAPQNGTHSSMPIHYLAIEPGDHTLPDGTKLVVGRKATKKQKHGSGVLGDEGWANISFDSVTMPTLLGQIFEYDPNGNRTILTEDNTAFAYSYLANSNRLLSVAGPQPKTYSYDAAGNITGDGAHTYSYDDRGRIVAIDAGVATYQYNGQQQRVRKDNGESTLFVYGEFGELLGEYDGLGNLLRENVWLDGAPIAVLTDTAAYQVHTDHLGTPRAITDTGTTIWKWESDPFGTTVVDDDPDGDSVPFTFNLRFSGQYYDEESGSNYNYFRTLDPSTGRYLESDPIGLLGGRNTYGYVGGNPLSFVDPLGLKIYRFPGNVFTDRPVTTSNSSGCQAPIFAGEFIVGWMPCTADATHQDTECTNTPRKEHASNLEPAPDWPGLTVTVHSMPLFSD